MYGEGANNLTGSSAAALKGSFIDGKFFPPELLISNIIVSSEFSSIIHSNDKEILSLLLIALEEGTVRNALVKGGNLNDGERQRIEEYEATFQDNRLCYQTHSTMWAATHTTDTIEDENRLALLTRFFIPRLRESEIPPETAWKDPALFQNANLISQLKRWLMNLLAQPTEPDHFFAEDVLQQILGGKTTERVNPRIVGDICRMIFAHHELFPNQTPLEVATQMESFLIGSESTKISQREKVIDFIDGFPHTMAEIIEATGVKKSTVMSIIKRDYALKTGDSPIKYYFNTKGTIIIKTNSRMRIPKAENN